MGNNFFSHELTRVLDADGRTRAELAKDFGIPASNLSQYSSGEDRCGEKQRDKILAKVPVADAILLSAAWLRDRIPDHVPHGSISVQVHGTLRESEAWPEMTPDFEAALRTLAHRGGKHKQIESAVLSFVDALTTR